MEIEHADNSANETVKDVWNTLNEKQKTVVYAMIQSALESKESGGKEEMKHNVFEGDTMQQDVLSHSDIANIFETAKRMVA